MTTPGLDVASRPDFSEVVEAEGHLVDSHLLNAIFDKVIERRATFEVLRFDIGRTNDEYSRLTLRVAAPGSTPAAGSARGPRPARLPGRIGAGGAAEAG